MEQWGSRQDHWHRWFCKRCHLREGFPTLTKYKSAALSNKVTNLKDLSIRNLHNKPPEEIKINETGMIAPYAIVNGMDTYFALAATNADLISHFKILGTNVFSLEDIHGGGDKDFDDVVTGIKF